MAKYRKKRKNSTRVQVSKKKFDEFLQKTATTTDSFKTICEDMNLAFRTMWDYVHKDEKRTQLYARAKESQLKMVAEDLLDIADDGRNDWMTINRGDMEIEVENKEVVNRSRLRIDTRKWLLSKLMPKVYGEKLDLTSKNEKISVTPIVIQCQNQEVAQSLTEAMKDGI